MLKLLKQIIFAILILGAAIVLAIPSKKGEQTPPGRTLIRYWSYWSGREAEQMQEIVDAFNATVGKEKNIWVQYISMSQTDQKTLVATAAGVPPDIAGVWGDQLAQFASMNAIEPLETMAAEHGMTPEYYKPAFWDACSYEGHLYAMVATPYSVALYWNKKIFAERADRLRASGLDPNRPPRTLQELDRYAQALDIWKDGHLVAAGFFEQQPGWWREHLYHWFGGKIIDEKTGKLTLTDPKVVQAYDWMRSYSQRIGASEVMRFSSGLPSTDTFDTPLNPFMTGAVAMIKQGPWFSSYMETLKPEMNRVKWSKEQERQLPREQRKDNYVWGVAPFPSAVPGLEDVSYAGVDLLVIPTTSGHQKEAFEFIAFVNRQDQMEKLCAMHGKNSPLAKMSRQYLDTHRNPYIDVFEELGASKNIYPAPAIPIWPQVRSELQDVATHMVLNDMTAEQALARAQARLQPLLDDFNARRERRRAEGLLQ
jgi:multiple sugar transport system substrate-binding protein